jgi:hypothetical protein
VARLTYCVARRLGVIKPALDICHDRTKFPTLAILLVSNRIVALKTLKPVKQTQQSIQGTWLDLSLCLGENAVK